MEQNSIATGEFACGASLSALGPVMLPNERLLNELNVPKGKPRMRPLIQCPDIVPCASSSRRAGLRTCMEQVPHPRYELGGRLVILRVVSESSRRQFPHQADLRHRAIAFNNIVGRLVVDVCRCLAQLAYTN